MCMGPELMMIASMAANAGGEMINQREANDNALREVQARNEMLRRHNQRQDEFAAQGRGVLGNLLEQISPGTENPLETAQNDRAAILNDLIAEDAPGTELPLASDAPKIVNAEYAGKMKEALSSNRDRADRMAKLGGFGEQIFRNALGRNAAGREIDTTNDFSRMEASLLPQYQDFRAIERHKPSSGMGEILKGVGTAMGFASGAGGGMGGGAGSFGKQVFGGFGPGHSPIDILAQGKVSPLQFMSGRM